MPSLSKHVIHERLSDLLHQLGRPIPNLDGAQYVVERDVDTGPPLTVSRGRLISPTTFEDTLHRFGEGASWIHANLYLTTAGDPVIGLSHGALVGNPQPTLNVSVDSQELQIVDV